MDSVLWNRIELVSREFPETETVQLAHERLRLFVKMETTNPSGSAKDRSAYWILREAVRRGDITRDTTVVESSSGNFALSMALFCGRLGVRFIPVIDPNVNTSTETVLRRSCARVEKVARIDRTGGYLLSRLDRVAELLAEIEDGYWPNQYANIDGAQAHYELTGRELVASLGDIDYLFVGVGSGAMIAGLSQRVAELSTDVTVVAVDVAGSVIFGGEPRRRHIPGIGSSIRSPLVDKAMISDVVVVSEREEVAGCHDLLRDHGIYAGGSTGCVYAAINRYFEGYRGPPPVVAFLCADRGEPYRDTIYDDSWVARTLMPDREVRDRSASAT
ncbi:2,3-diaminopropionate biosynthesis protein SbnA [Alloactinosynnema sp. L-07]|uniref:2,3-diaminopropionate biosynthesis protein SbnA n=1 Tax=Alloactinosynnema sp. L-07 TaxID=1653480 RepID=UPI0006B5189A|nr:2,3-diaminopropionate biosynthesis protein SbnA [Alloactinosynnema sp. L-07]